MTVSKFDTPFQRGFLMGMETIATQDVIVAPIFYRQPENEKLLAQFNQGVEAAYKVYRAA